MTTLPRAVSALLARGCTVRQVLQCSIPAEMFDGPDKVAVRLLVSLVRPYVGTRNLSRAVEDAALERNTSGRLGGGVDDDPAGRRRVESMR